MSKLRHTLQLLHGGALSTRQIAAALGISKSTVGDIASYARAAGVDWALAQSLSDEELQARLYKPPVARESRHLEPDHAHIHRELRRPGVTLQLAVMSARPAKPRDKPKVEVGVQVVERWILAAHALNPRRGAHTTTHHARAHAGLAPGAPAVDAGQAHRLG